MSQPHTPQIELKRSKAPTDDSKPDLDVGPPDAFEYILLKCDGEAMVLEVCAREDHRCERIDDELHCFDCELVQPFPDDGMQASVTRWNDD